jgi:hypothetical protein
MDSATWGVSNTARQIPASVVDARSQLEQALRRIPEDDKASYLEAVRVAPHLVETECDPIRFLRVEGGNAAKAAARLCMYWKKRTQLFGKRAFLSLRDCSGSGALDEAAVKILERGSPVQLPDDAKGSPVFCLDPSRLQDGLKTPGNARLQVMFHVLDKVAESNPVSQIRGAILLRVANEPSWDRNKAGKATAILEQAIPIKIKVIRILCVPPPGAMRIFEQTALPLLQKVFAEIWGDRAQVHLASSPAHLAQQLEATGLRKPGLPLCCGGTLNLDKWDIRVAQKNTPPRSLPPEGDEQEQSGPSPPSAHDRELVHQAVNNGAPKDKNTNLEFNRDRPDLSINLSNPTKVPAPCNDANATTSAVGLRELIGLDVDDDDARIKNRMERKRKNDIVYS